MDSQFCFKIRSLREQCKMYLRQVAPLLEMDAAQLSKIEKGLRQMKKEQISIIAEIYKTDEYELETLWLSDQIVEVVKDCNTALQAIYFAGNQIKESKQTIVS